MTDERVLGSLERLDPRQVWESEPYQFTPWLRSNIHLLGGALGLEIDADVQQEVAVGLFSADLLGTDVSTRAGILVENQLAQSDHSHLGQLLTYAGGLDADILVWVCTKVREEHQQAITWLNERTSADVLIFAVEIELLKIDDSRPAPHFKVVVAPNDWQKGRPPRSGDGTASSSARAQLYKAFWARLIAALNERHPGFTTASPERAPKANWFGTSIGRSGLQDNLAFGWEDGGYVLRAELYIDVEDKQQNELIFDYFHAAKDEIEAEFGEPLIWTRREDIRASRIYVKRPGSIEDSPEKLGAYLDWGVERMRRLRQVFGSRAKSLALPMTPPSVPSA